MTSRTRDGASAEITDERIAVLAPTGRVLFEYFADGGRCVVHSPAADLDIVAERRIRIAAGELVAVEGKRLSAIVEEAELDAEDAKLRSKTLTTVAEAAHHAAGVMELEAIRLVGRFQNAYQQIEGLAQTQAGRIRSIAKETLQLLGRRTIVKAEEETKVKGERIHLG